MCALQGFLGPWSVVAVVVVVVVVVRPGQAECNYCSNSARDVPIESECLAVKRAVN